jgi:hypothetical protein
VRIQTLPHRRSEEGSILAYFVILIVIVSVLASVSALVMQTVTVSHRRSDMVSAAELAEGGASLAAADLENAMSRSGTLSSNLVSNPSGSYTLDSELSSTSSNVYKRVIATPFSGQTVTARIWMTNAVNPAGARVVAVSKVGDVTQSATVNLQMKFGYGAAIISDNPGTTSASTSKNTTAGNVCLNGDKNGPLVINGGADGKAVLANGRCNYDTYATVAPSAISMTNYSTANQVPDYTDPGSSDQLFDFARFIAVANKTGNHYTNLATFITAANLAALSPAGAMEGVVVVDLKKSDPDLSPTQFPNGINVRGTLIFNFSSDFSATDKIINTATVNINKADLSGLNPADPTTYTTGYPPVYTNPAKNPVNVDIGPAFQNFTSSDDLPAMMYNIGIFDLHGDVNICGVMYSPSFMEIENKQDDQVQYFNGSLIVGGGIYVENLKRSKTVVTYDPRTIDVLATSAGKGKRVYPVYWE